MDEPRRYIDRLSAVKFSLANVLAKKIKVKISRSNSSRQNFPIIIDVLVHDKFHLRHF